MPELQGEPEDISKEKAKIAAKEVCAYNYRCIKYYSCSMPYNTFCVDALSLVCSYISACVTVLCALFEFFVC